MGIRLSNMIANQASLSLAPMAPFDDATITVQFRPGAVTMKWRKSLNEVETEAEGAALLAEVIVGWDVLDDNDQPMPCTGEVLERTPLLALKNIGKAIGDATSGERLGEPESA